MHPFFRLAASSFALTAMLFVAGCELVDDVLDPNHQGGGHQTPRMVNALEFDGQNDYIVVPNGRDLQLHPNGSFTIDAWIRGDRWGRWNWIAAHARSNENNDFLFGFDNGRVRFITCDLSNDLFGHTRIEPGTWYHVAGVQDVDRGTLRIYVNGELDGELRLSGRPERTTGNLFIGARESYGTDRPAEFFDGVIHELRIWRTAMSQEQIREIRKNRFPHDEYDDLVIAKGDLGMIAHWPLNEGSGTIAHDVSGNGHDGRIYGDARWISVADPVR